MTQRLRPTRIFAAGLAGALALAGAACGGGGGTSKTGVSGQSGASKVRGDALAYIAVDSDLSSNQWKTVDKLLRKFPSRDQGVSALRAQLSQKNVNYDRDVKPALGSEVDIVVAASSSGTAPVFAALTKPDDPKKFDALVSKMGQGSSSPPVSKPVGGGWYALGSNAAAINGVLKAKGGKSLGDDGLFKDAVSQLPTDALVKAYVNGQKATQLYGGILGGSANAATKFAAGANPLANLKYAAAALVSQGDGFKLQGAVRGVRSGGATPYSSKLISGVPQGALAFATFRGGNSIQQTVNQLQQNPAFNAGIQRFESMLGVRLADLVPLLKNETAFYVRPGAPIPEISLAFDSPNGFSTVDRLMTHVAALAHTQVTSGTESGVTVKTLTVNNFAIHYAGFSGRVLITTGPTGIRDYRASGSKLSSDSVFKDATSAAGMPSKTSGMLYVNLKDSVPVIENFAQTAGKSLPPQATGNLAPLRSFVMWGTGSGDLDKFVAFLQIK